MHIPDGFLDGKTVLASAGLSVMGLGTALRQSRLGLPRRQVPMLGLSAAFVFAAQMLNFPIAGGTSGHLIGATLTAVLLGPAAAVVVISAVLIVQCFVFADGGVLAVGANVFNMAIVGSISGYAAYRVLCRTLTKLMSDARARMVAATFAAWCSVVLAAFCCSGELALSGTAAWKVVFPAMVNVHILIGVGEAAITALVLTAIAKTRPELLLGPSVAAGSRGIRPVIAYGMLIAVGLAVFVAPFASPWPDGLEKVASSLGFGVTASAPPPVALIPDYEMPGVASPIWATGLAGGIGTVLVFAFSMILARVLIPGRAAEDTAATPSA